MNNGKHLATQRSLNTALKSVCDIMHHSNCAGALEYVPELTWILFLRILDEREMHEAEEAEKVGKRKPLMLSHFDEFFRLLQGRPTAHIVGRYGARRSRRKTTTSRR